MATPKRTAKQAKLATISPFIITISKTIKKQLSFILFKTVTVTYTLQHHRQLFLQGLLYLYAIYVDFCNCHFIKIPKDAFISAILSYWLQFLKEILKKLLWYCRLCNEKLLILFYTIFFLLICCWLAFFKNCWYSVNFLKNESVSVSYSDYYCYYIRWIIYKLYACTMYVNVINFVLDNDIK